MSTITQCPNCGKAGLAILPARYATGISDAAAKRAAIAAGDLVLEVVGERGAMMAVGRWVLILAGWEVAVAITLIQILIWYFSDDDLQTWFENCVFGRAPKSNPPWTAKQQNDAFAKSLEAVGLSTQGQQ